MKDLRKLRRQYGSFFFSEKIYKRWGILFCVLGIVVIFLPWIRIDLFGNSASSSGIYRNGWPLIIFSIVCAFLIRFKKKRAIIPALMYFAYSAYLVFDILSLTGINNSIEVRVGIGVYLLPVIGVLLVIATLRLYKGERLFNLIVE